ncbi:MAG: glucuronate isomerase [Oscillospiraceae bacterium]|nr:glucuronate isomerase [Oscillospiraceae bacterium]
MKQFMDENFMLNNDTAIRLYHGYAKDMPIFDYHCHLSPQMMYEDKPFGNITEIFLGGDHYKWRYMRSNGIDESYITGDKSNYEKFKAFCGCLQYAVGNPLYHWTHLELKRYFGVNDIVTEDSCDTIWEKCNAVIRDTQMSPSKLINQSNVAVICTTDDPADSLEYHKRIAEKGHINARVLPALRPDFLINIDKDTFTDYIEKLSNASGIKIESYDDAVKAVYSRIDYFHSLGCRVSDHALDGVPYNTDYNAVEVFKKAMSGEKISRAEADAYKCETLIRLAKKYKELDWAMQLHIGALRNNNTRMFEKLGADTGFDSIADYSIAAELSALLDAMEKNDNLPKTILYTLNPKDNYVLATMLGNFQSAQTAGKIQFGSGWWFNDQRDGMTEQMRALANLGALNKFVGMLTDSRSFLSYTRHEYFRRILCNLIGEWVENGEFPADYKILGKIVEDISYNNAVKYFNLGE